MHAAGNNRTSSSFLLLPGRAKHLPELFFQAGTRHRLWCALHQLLEVMELRLHGGALCTIFNMLPDVFTDSRRYFLFMRCDQQALNFFTGHIHNYCCLKYSFLSWWMALCIRTFTAATDRSRNWAISSYFNPW